MRMQKSSIIIVLFIGIIIGTCTIAQNNSKTTLNSKNSLENDTGTLGYIDNNKFPRLSSSRNFENLEDVFTTKLNNYSSLGYFPQIYKPSLQATYYAIYILDTIGKIGQIDQTRITNFIMAHYNSSTYTFIDVYAERYLSIDFSTRYEYYPFTTLLEVNCYAILTLDMLGQIGLIDKQESIAFIWSCFNPITGGFIGRPYATSPNNEYRISTMDNTYFALITLDLLMDNWLGYETQISDTIDYINSLQESGIWEFGGFWNDLEKGLNNFYSLEDFAKEPNVLSSYYCVKSLELFGMEDTIRVNDFLDYLDALYNEGNNFFQYSMYPKYIIQLSVPASAVGLELSDIYGYVGIDRSAVLNFIFSNRNSMGSWEQCNISGYHELIDSYQVIRSLANTGDISQLTSGEINEIANSMTNYISGDGFSALSDDYMSLSLLYSIVNSFDLYGRVGDLDIQMIYDFIDDATEKYVSPAISVYETKPLNISPIPKHGEFRAYPIKYSFPNRYSSLKTLYKALDVLHRTFKLDDFDGDYDLDDTVLEVVNSQYLNDTQSNFGGFLANSYWNFHFGSEELKNNNVHFKYSYWALKILKVISEYKGLGDYNSMGVDTLALYTYIDKNIINTPTILYYPSEYSDNPEEHLEHTYYMIYVLKEINMFNLNTQEIDKIKSFVEQNLDYNNIKNIYYSYKISKILGLSFPFDLDLTYDLIQDIYLQELNEYFLTTEYNSIEQDAFFWICDMAKNDDIKISAQYLDSVKLGGINNITVSLQNIVLREFGPYINVKFESDQIGKIPFTKQSDYTFNTELTIPDNPNNFPRVTGNITIYSGSLKIQDFPISFQTISDRYAAIEGAEEEDDESIKGSASDYNNDIQGAIPIMLTIIAVPACVFAVSVKKQRNSRLKSKY